MPNINAQKPGKFSKKNNSLIAAIFSLLRPGIFPITLRPVMREKVDTPKVQAMKALWVKGSWGAMGEWSYLLY